MLSLFWLMNWFGTNGLVVGNEGQSASVFAQSLSKTKLPLPSMDVLRRTVLLLVSAVPVSSRISTPSSPHLHQHCRWHILAMWRTWACPCVIGSFGQWHRSAFIRVSHKGRQWRDVNCGLVGSILCRTHGWVEYAIVFDVAGPWQWNLNLLKNLVKLTWECLLRPNLGCWIQ